MGRKAAPGSEGSEGSEGSKGSEGEGGGSAAFYSLLPLEGGVAAGDGG